MSSIDLSHLQKITEIIQTAPEFAFARALLSQFPSAELYVVGGTVRDTLLGRPSKDVDFVVRNVSAEDLEKFLITQGHINLSGKHFGVFKLQPSGTQEKIDIALPRREQAHGTGKYHDVDVESDLTLPIEMDLERRDFTVNAMAWDIQKSQLIDPFNGVSDLEQKIMRTVGDPIVCFQEDHTRVDRGLRLAKELEFSFDPATQAALTKYAPAPPNRRA